MRGSGVVVLVATVLLATGTPCAQEGEKRTLSLDEIVEGRAPSFRAILPSYTWAPDGKRLVTGRGRLFVDPDSGETEAAPTSPSPGRRRRAPLPAPLRSLRGKARRLVRSAPGGRYHSFVRDHGLLVYDASLEREIEVGEAGSEERYHGELDWVCQEEIYGRGNWHAQWWDPSGTRLAYLSLRVGQVPRFPIVSYERGGPKTVFQRYPRPGEPNPSMELRVATLDPEGRPPAVVTADLGRYPSDRLVVRVGWMPDSSRVLCYVQDRVQTWLELVEVDPATGRTRRILREEGRDSWVRKPPLPRWLADGSFLWLSERDGNRHVWHHEGSGELRRQVTRGAWNVREILRVDEKAGLCWFSATKAGPLDEQGYVVGLDGEGLRRITKEPGRHRLAFNAAGTRILDRFSRVDDPGRVQVLRSDGSLVRVLAKARVPALATHVFSARELLRIPARDGRVLDASLIRPPDFDPKKVYAVWIPVYAGPHSQTVRNEWRADAMQQFLAQQGLLVLEVNVRSASGGGMADASLCYRRLGSVELADLEDAVAWLCARPWADASRVGITGWSYGGFIAAYALTHSKSFRLGVAGAGVYDWRLYDTIYTERFMDLPARNAAGYDASSCIAAASDLAGRLVLLHGLEDENVHAENVFRFAAALTAAGKDFGLMVYPGAGHGLRTAAQRGGRHRLTMGEIRRWLLEPAQPRRK